MKKTLQTLMLLLMATAALYATPARPNARKMEKIVNASLDFSAAQAMAMYDSVKDISGQLPNQTGKEGELLTCGSGGWVSGFHPGLLWYLYEYTGDEAILSAASDLTERIAPEQFNTKTHDLGFMLGCSYGNGYRLTGRDDYRQVLINGANSLASRFNPTVGCIRSWGDRSSQKDYLVIIDNMMNLELMTMSSGLTGDLGNYEISKIHANTTIKNHFRPDGSSFHVVDYDQATGEVRLKRTQQGLADGSSWARGQSWGLYGFTMMYRQTGDEAYLKQAVSIANYLLGHKNLPKDKIPYWDYDAPVKGTTPRDASAGAIMASSLIELSQYVDDGSLSSKFLSAAEQIITSLSGRTYRAAKVGDNAGFIIKHSTVHFTEGNYDTGLTYADYYFVEALMRYRRLMEDRPVVDVRTAWSENPDRLVWISTLDRFARPVLSNLAKGTLKKNMPVETIPGAQGRDQVTYLEALGRVMTGIAPWLELGPDDTPEGRLRAEYIDLARLAVAQAVDPDSPDYMNFNRGGQPLVDAAFLSHGLLRAPIQIWGGLDAVTRERLVKELKSSRVIRVTWDNNWVLFESMVEAALLEFTGEWDADRALHGVNKFKDEWYKGDGWYGDGNDLHSDYYNSFVIHPMLYQVLETMKKHGVEGWEFIDADAERFSRFAAVQERLISPEGTYPVVGRSICYRVGAFQALSDVAWRHLLPGDVNPAQVRCALTAVIRRQMNASGNYDPAGWLTLGFAGHQPDMAEVYISTGSLYLCSAGYIALGLPESDPFWSGDFVPWTSLKAWSGMNIPADHAIEN